MADRALARSRSDDFDSGAPAVLVVDDNSANLLAVEAILAPLGYQTVCVTSATDALKALLQRDFAVILMDVQMPGMDGFEAASAIKSHPRTADIPIIFITAISREATHVFKGYALGAVDYLLKPFDPEILRAKVALFVDLDIGLPNEDGYALIREIRRLAPEDGGHIPAIAVTGYARPEDGKRSLSEGFQMHLAKPVERTELVALVASLAAKPK